MRIQEIISRRKKTVDDLSKLNDSFYLYSLGCLDFVNMGFRMNIDYSSEDKPLDVERLAELFGEGIASFRKNYPDTRLILVGKTGVYVTRIEDIKVTTLSPFQFSSHQKINQFLMGGM